MKIAVTGKGGVGKTSITALLCYSFNKAGYKVLALDTDPDTNLAATLGFPEPEKIVPIVEMKELIAERTGVQPGSMGMLFKLNPTVDDIRERFSVSHNGISLLVMGRIKQAGTGCYCPENAFVRELVGHLLLEEKDLIIMDMEAGIEHLGRGTTRDVDAFIVVVEPGRRSLETAERVIKLASELGVECYFIIINKARGEEDRALVESFFGSENIIGMIQYSEGILESGKEKGGIRIEDMTIVDNIRNKLMKGVIND